MRHAKDRGIIKTHLKQVVDAGIREYLKAVIDLHPVIIKNRRIACSDLGKVWCKNLDRFNCNNIVRGKAYARAGAVLSLICKNCEVHALIQGMGEKPYEVTIGFSAVNSQLRSLKEEISEIACLRLTREEYQKKLASLALVSGFLFPDIGDIVYQCKCIEWRQMCWHVASALYGIGNRLDEDPLLLFELRKIPVSTLFGI